MSEWRDVGVGPTDELSLRVSVASLARVVFADPVDGSRMLALERKAKLYPTGGRVIIKVQPFGGALRINSLLPLKERIGNFHFDSVQSRFERDFRLYIHPSTWDAVRDYCLEQFRSPDEAFLESAPDRELAEEFSDALRVDMSLDQYESNHLWTVLENVPVSTANIPVESLPTVRIYRVFEVRITDSALVDRMITNSRQLSNRELGVLGRKNARKGGMGWANALLVTPLEHLISFYHAMPEVQRNSLAEFEGNNLESNVTALFDSVLAPKYRPVP